MFNHVTDAAALGGTVVFDGTYHVKVPLKRLGGMLYTYMLHIDGVPAATKKLVVVK